MLVHGGEVRGRTWWFLTTDNRWVGRSMVPGPGRGELFPHQGVNNLHVFAIEKKAQRKREECLTWNTVFKLYSIKSKSPKHFLPQHDYWITISPCFLMFFLSLSFSLQKKFIRPTCQYNECKDLVRKPLELLKQQKSKVTYFKHYFVTNFGRKGQKLQYHASSHR
jgi:hypothetical protein